MEIHTLLLLSVLYFGTYKVTLLVQRTVMWAYREVTNFRPVPIFALLTWTGSYELIFVLSRASKQNDVENRRQQNKKKFERKRSARNYRTEKVTKIPAGIRTGNLSLTGRMSLGHFFRSVISHASLPFNYLTSLLTKRKKKFPYGFKFSTLFKSMKVQKQKNHAKICDFTVSDIMCPCLWVSLRMDIVKVVEKFF